MVTRRVRIRRGSVPFEEKGPKFSPGDLVFFAPETTVFKRLFQVREMPDDNVYTIVRLTDDKALTVDENDLSPVTEAWMRMIRAKMVYSLSTVQEWFDTHTDGDPTGDRTNELLNDADVAEDDEDDEVAERTGWTGMAQRTADSLLAFAEAAAATGRSSGSRMNVSNIPRTVQLRVSDAYPEEADAGAQEADEEGVGYGEAVQDERGRWYVWEAAVDSTGLVTRTKRYI